MHSAFENYPHRFQNLTEQFQQAVNPTQQRWDPMTEAEPHTDFIDGLIPFARNGASNHHIGSTIYLYACNQSMQQRFFYNADGELLIVPVKGQLKLLTENGSLHLKPKHIGVIPRGVKFQVELFDETAYGYVCENHAAPLTLPELGPIGANGLANPRDFNYPQAEFIDQAGDYILINKFQDCFYQAKLKHHPLDVVAWHGNYSAYQYDLTLFNTMNTVSFDHADPSIFTVLTSQSNTAGVANLDFVIFPSRWMVAENTFRPPYYHRNFMSEFMGLIHGVYDAKQAGFAAGGVSIHNCMSAHGPDKKSFEAASHAELKPEYYHGTLAFMFESNLIWQPSLFAMQSPQRQQDYLNCWQDLDSQFNNAE